MAEVTYKVEGMTCGGCVSSVKKALEKLGATADVDLPSGRVKVAGAIDEARVKAAIEAAGFDFAGRVSPA